MHTNTIKVYSQRMMVANRGLDRSTYCHIHKNSAAGTVDNALQRGYLSHHQNTSTTHQQSSDLHGMNASSSLIVVNANACEGMDDKIKERRIHTVFTYRAVVNVMRVVSL